MFSELQEVSEIVRFTNVPNTTSIILPNLRIIRGEELIANHALLVENSVIGSFILPRLTQISKGNAFFENTGTLCNYLSVRWPDILDNNGTLIDGAGTCDPVQNPDCKFVIIIILS